MKKPVVITAPFATVWDTAKVLKVPKKRVKELIALLEESKKNGKK